MILSGGCCHLGDLIWAARLLHAVPGLHDFYMNATYVPEMTAILEGTGISVFDQEGKPEEFLRNTDCWIANGRSGFPYDHPRDIVDFIRRYMNALGEQAGFPNVFPDRYSMLTQFPSTLKHCPAPEFDILALNTDPGSYQCPNYSNDEFDVLLSELGKKQKVLAINPTKSVPWGRFNIAQIGNLSMRAKLIIGGASGPVFPTFNIWNTTIPRYVFLDPIFLDYGMPCISHSNTEVMRLTLQENGWL